MENQLMTENRYIGLDVGTKRIGIAISDPLGIFAQPLKTILRKPDDVSASEICKLVQEFNAKEIIAGLPKHMNGSIGEQANDVISYVKILETKLNKKVLFEDERLTSKSAERFLVEQNKKPSRNKGLTDMASAAIILEQYLNRRR
jgi:putative holliday junction resolvase